MRPHSPHRSQTCQSIFVFPFPGYLDTITGSFLSGGACVRPRLGLVAAAACALRPRLGPVAAAARAQPHARTHSQPTLHLPSTSAIFPSIPLPPDIEDFVSTTTFLPRVGFLILIMQYTAAMHTERCEVEGIARLQ